MTRPIRVPVRGNDASNNRRHVSPRRGTHWPVRGLLVAMTLLRTTRVRREITLPSAKDVTRSKPEDSTKIDNTHRSMDASPPRFFRLSGKSRPFLLIVSHLRVSAMRRPSRIFFFFFFFSFYWTSSPIYPSVGRVNDIHLLFAAHSIVRVSYTRVAREDLSRGKFAEHY
jgi:hypothetical protein